jgi:hypothetical protein
MIKRIRGSGVPVGGTRNRLDAAKQSVGDDSQLLMEQWKRQIVAEKLVNARQRQLLDRESPVHPASLDQIRIVSRIGGLRLLWKFRRKK